MDFGLKADLLNWYKFEGNANDELGNNNGTVYGAILTTDQFGDANQAYDFDGIDDKIALGSMTAPDLTETHTFSFIFKYDTPSSWGILWYIYTVGSEGMGIRITDSDQLQVFYVERTGGATAKTVTSTTNLTAGVWHHATVVFNGSFPTDCEIFIDAVKSSNTIVNPSFGGAVTLTNNSFVANDDDAYGFFLDGQISEIKRSSKNERPAITYWKHKTRNLRKAI